MKRYRIEFNGVIEIEAEDEDEAWSTFGCMSDEEVRGDISYVDVEEVE